MPISKPSRLKTFQGSRLHPENIRMPVRSNTGALEPHTILDPDKEGGGGRTQGDLAAAIKSAFDPSRNFAKFAAAGLAALVPAGLALVKDGKLAIDSTPNQDTPFSLGAKALLALDVWEHAYYLKYQNVRGDYIKAWWNVVNWDSASQLFAAAKK